jgi:DNA-binding HxlR family transcriptional regulator
MFCFHRQSKIVNKKSFYSKGKQLSVERRFNQTPGDTNLSVLGYLTKIGSWLNLRQITTGTPGSDLNRDRLKKIMDSFIEKGFVETRDSENPKAKLEYKITEKGKNAFTKCISFDPDIKFVLGLKDTEFFPTEN